jgi:hypothetical protein
MASVTRATMDGDPPLVPAEWRLDPLEPDGARELYDRVRVAPAVRVPRAELDGRTDLTARELYELGVTLAPLDLRSAGGMVAWRLVAFGGAVLCALAAAMALYIVLGPLGLADDTDPATLDMGVALAVVFLAAAAGGRWLLRRAVAELREISARRRRARPRGARPAAEDPAARAATAVLHGPGCLRVQLLWLRGDVRDASQAEVRVLAESRVDETDEGRAQDAMIAFSEVAMRARAAHELRVRSGLRALTLGRRRSAPGQAAPRLPRDVSASARVTGADPRRPVDPAWEPEPLTDAGAAELARRLVLARVERWSPSALAPLLVDDPAAAGLEAPDWPTGHGERVAARRPAPPHLNALRGIAVAGLVVAVFALAVAGDGTGDHVAEAIGYGALAVALAAFLARRLAEWRDPGQRLLRAVRTVAGRTPLALEGGLPGAAGRFAVARGRREGSGERVALLHVRAAADDGKAGALEVRTLAWRELDEAERGDPEALRPFWVVGDDASFRAAGAQRSARALTTFLGRLGRATAGTPERPLRHEPLAWLAALVVPLLVAASVHHTLDGTWTENGVVARAFSYAWPLAAALVLWRTARRIVDPFLR